MALITDGMRWFKHNFRPEADSALGVTPYSLDFLTAIAVQETFEVWSRLFPTLLPAQVLQFCVGDTLDAPDRSVFPKTKAELVAEPDGQALFEVAREALESMAKYVPSYSSTTNNPEKFCHAFGIFQHDIQFCKAHPAFFLERQWHNFDACLDKAVMELDEAKRRAYGKGKDHLTDEEMVYVAIAYNQGHVATGRGFKQGYFDRDSGKYYGELIAGYLALAHSVSGA